MPFFVAPTDVGHISRYRRYGLRFFELKFPAATAVRCLGGRRARGTYVRAPPSNLVGRKEGQFPPPATKKVQLVVAPFRVGFC